MSTDNKRLVLEFLRLVTSGAVDEAYDQYVDTKGVHHNPHFKAGFESLRLAMKQAHKESPVQHFTPKSILSDRDLVAVHSHIVQLGTKEDIQVVHIFRIENGKITELWDCAAPIPAKNINTDGTF